MRKLIVCAVLVCAFAVAHAANIQKMVADTQRMSQKSGDMTLVWWIPSDFWRESLIQSKKLTDRQIDDFVAVLDHYTVFAVVSGQIGPLGGFTPKAPDELRLNVRLTTAAGQSPLLAASELQADAQNFISMMKPIMANMLGPFGKSMEFLVYNNPKKNSDRLDPKKKGRFSYQVFDEKFEWRLPLGSFLPDKVDKKSGDVFPGDFEFNPYTGERLQ